MVIEDVVIELMITNFDKTIGCPEGQMRCGSGSGRDKCILKSSICDRKPDCDNGFDESNCGNVIALLLK